MSEDGGAGIVIIPLLMALTMTAFSFCQRYWEERECPKYGYCHKDKEGKYE